MRSLVLVGVFLLGSVSSGFADVAAYCDAYAIDFANLSEKDDVQWQARREDALAACLRQYRDAPAVVKTKRSKPAKPIVKELPAEQKRPEIKEGSPEWYEYCARKYTSFDRKTGSYLSKTGIERKCLVTADFE